MEKETVPEMPLSVPSDNQNTPVTQSRLHLPPDIYQESDEVHPGKHRDR
jgi:hypothetical protein